MQPFVYERANDLGAAIAAVAADPLASFVAGATELANWMKEGIAAPRRLVDISRLPLSTIELRADRLRLGALARMGDVAAHPDVRAHFPAIAESLELSASPQLRNMASIGGNLMQRTRCPYFRAETELPCNKRRPGSGCAALRGETRAMAIFSYSQACVATHPSDLAVVFVALDSTVHVRGPRGERAIPLVDLYRLPAESPERDTILEHGELIVAVDVPCSTVARHSHYLKVRERASYEFALVSVAAGVALDGQPGGRRIGAAHVALGGVAPRPWRLTVAEQRLAGSQLYKPALRAVIEDAFADAKPLPHNAFKVELAKRAVVRALLRAGEVASAAGTA